MQYPDCTLVTKEENMDIHEYQTFLKQPPPKHVNDIAEKRVDKVGNECVNVQSRLYFITY